MWPNYQPALDAALARAGIAANLACSHAADEVDYIIFAPDGGLQDFTPFTRLKAVLSLWAGVEAITTNPTLTVPLTRMVDNGLSAGMVEYVLGYVLRYHLDIDRYSRANGPHWQPRVPPLARQRRVTVLGLGALGVACAETLAGIGFNVCGWSRGPHRVEGITCRFGPDGFAKALAEAEILVTLLPLTPATENLLNAETLALLPRGARLINPGRGALIDDDALIAALQSGQIGHATLDTFRVEPLPEAHPFWQQPNVTITPHIAAETRPDTASDVIAENIRRAQANEPLLHLVDRRAGY
ncbi:MAG: glyoxylate/hydroxypyruvate reductase A [Rhodobacteraceae bacterium]|nr:glyoxylate/hydroxypyruvate reductase A [Paracoccaceae bacterium]